MERDAQNGQTGQTSLTWAYTLGPVGGIPPVERIDPLLFGAGGPITDTEIRRIAGLQKRWITGDGPAT